MPVKPHNPLKSENKFHGPALIYNLILLGLTVLIILSSAKTLPMAIMGVGWFMLDVVTLVTGSPGGNLTGVGLIVGPIWAATGFAPLILLLVVLYLRAKRIKNAGQKTLISVKFIRIFSLALIISLFGFTLYAGIAGNISWN